ncbi:MAG: sigma-70 family RNA polymerase sigma factor [Steroidobacteraceae bacterium]
MLDPVTEVRNVAAPPGAPHGLPDLLLIERARARDARAIETLTRRYAQRLYRLARSVLGEESAAEDAVQETCVAAFEELARHEPGGKFAAWLTRLALERARARRKAAQPAARTAAAPRHPLEPAIDALPEVFRTVFVLRALEGISGPETALALGLHETTVRTRLYRAHRRLAVPAPLDGPAAVFELDGARAERIVAGVLAGLRTGGA